MSRLVKQISRSLGLVLALLVWMGFMPSAQAYYLPLESYRGSLLGSPFLLQTGSVEELRQQQQRVEQQRSDVSRERQRLQNLERAAEGSLAGLGQNLQSTTTQIKDVEYQLQLAKKSLKEFQEDLILAEKNYQQQQTATVNRLQFLQRQRTNQGWAVLLQSQDLNQFLDRRYRLKRVFQADRKILARLQAQAVEIQRQRAAIEQQKNQIALLTQQLFAQKSEIEANARSQGELVNRLRSDRAALEAAESQLMQDSQSLRGVIQRRVQQRARGATGPGSIVVQGTGQMSYPTDAVITSDFGWRVHPILGYQRFHTGTDFGAEYGSPIRAADRGTVILAEWYGGYGNAIIIDHGNGVTTLYGHSSELYVSEGQTVERGQAIAAVGSTGLSTGPHLHFEVRLNGEPVDPMGYL